MENKETLQVFERQRGNCLNAIGRVRDAVTWKTLIDVTNQFYLGHDMANTYHVAKVERVKGKSIATPCGNFHTYQAALLKELRASVRVADMAIKTLTEQIAAKG